MLLSLLIPGCAPANSSDSQAMARKPVHTRVEIALPDGARYIGQMRNGKPNGSGVMTASNGNKQDGFFVNGELSTGTVTMTFDNGIEAEIEYENAVTKNAKIHFPGGFTYSGGYSNSKFNGSGEFKAPDQYVFTGKFQNGEFKSGVLVTEYGDRYEGEFRGEGMRNNPLFHGKGSYSWKDGRKFVGQWLSSKISNGIYMEPNGISYIGSNETDYTAPFRLEKIRGTGELRLPDSRRYIGYLGDKDREGVMIDEEGHAVIGTLDLSQGLDSFKEQKPELARKNFNAYYLIDGYAIKSIKYFSVNDMMFMQQKMEQSRQATIAFEARMEREQRSRQIQRCNDHIKNQVKELDDFVGLVNTMECGASSEWGGVDNLQAHIDELSSERSINESNLGDTGFWIEKLRYCVEEVEDSIELQTEYKFNKGYKPSNYCDDSESIARVEGIQSIFEQYRAHAESVLVDATRYADDRERGGYARMRQADDAHRAQLNNNFQQWRNKLTSSSQSTLDQLNRINRNTQLNMEKISAKVQETPRDDRSTTSPNVLKNVQKRFAQDRVLKAQEKVAKKQKEQQLKKQREQEIEAELAQYQSERENARVRMQNEARRKEQDSEAERARKCIPILAKNPYACSCFDLGPHKDSNHCSV